MKTNEDLNENDLHLQEKVTIFDLGQKSKA